MVLYVSISQNLRGFVVYPQEIFQSVTPHTHRCKKIKAAAGNTVDYKTCSSYPVISALDSTITSTATKHNSPTNDYESSSVCILIVDSGLCRRIQNEPYPHM